MSDEKYVYDKKSMKLLELTEPLNFSEYGWKHIQWQWKSFFSFLNEDQKNQVKSGKITLKEALVQNQTEILSKYRNHLRETEPETPEISLQNLSVSNDELEIIFRNSWEVPLIRAKTPTKSREEVKNCENASASFTDNLERKFGQISLAVQIIENCDDEIIDLIVEQGNDFHRPVLFEFYVGGSTKYPKLPIFGRHFTNFTAKYTSYTAELVLKKTFSVLERFFPDHVKFWSSNDLDSNCSPNYKLDLVEVCSTDMFYKVASEKFENVTEKKKVDRARRKLAKIICRKPRPEANSRPSSAKPVKVAPPEKKVDLLSMLK